MLYQRRTLSLSTRAWVLVSLILNTGVPVRASEPYTVIDLGTLGGPASDAFAINSLGVVVGQADRDEDHYRGFLFDGDVLRDLGTLGGDLSRAWGINDAGQIVGQARQAGDDGYGPHQAFLWEAGIMRDLSAFGDTQSVAYDINAQGQVVGTFTVGSRNRAFLWENGIRRDLGSLGEESEAFGINDLGQVVGLTTLPAASNVYHAFLYDPVIGMRDLGTLGGSNSQALKINTAGQVVGFSETSDGSVRAFLYDGAETRELGRLRGGNKSYAHSLNRHGHVVGASVSPTPVDDFYACLWKDGQIYDLNEWLPAGSAWQLTSAHAINDRGLIAGFGYRSGVPIGSSQTRAFLLIPQSIAPPEPPIAPEQLIVRSSTTDERSRLDLTWTDRSNTEAGFELQRRTDGGEWTTVTTAIPNATSYADAGLAAFTRYRYRVRAVSAAGVSDWTAEAVAETGIGPIVSVSPTQIEFGKHPVGLSSGSQSVFLTNRGTGPLTIHGVTFTGSGRQEFSLGSTVVPRILQPGQTRELRVTFTPSATGSWLAALAIESDSAASPHTIPLSGAGGGPSLKIAVAAAELPDRVEFGALPLGATGVVKQLTLTNTGTSRLSIRSIRLSVAAKGEFAFVSGQKPVNLAPGSSRVLAVRFTPMRLGPRAAILSVVHNGENTPQEVALAGDGILSQDHTAGRALHPTGAKLVVTAIDGASPPRTLRPSAGQSLTLALHLRFRNGAVAELTDGPGAAFTAGAGHGAFTAANVWRALPIDAGRRVDLFGTYAAHIGGPALRARLSLTVRR